jgi:superfamily I DNA/RNA helicase
MLDALEVKPETYDAVIVDEAQDFRKSWWVVVESLVAKDGCFYVFYDPRQNLFGTEASLPSLPTVLPLSENCRTTININNAIQEYGNVKIFPSGMSPEGRPVRVITYSDEQEMRKALFSVIKELKQTIALKSSQVVVLSPHSFERSSFASQPNLFGYNVVKFKGESIKENEIAFESIHAFKGLEADAVIIVGFDKQSTYTGDILPYVAASRAKHILYMIHDQSWKYKAF